MGVKTLYEYFYKLAYGDKGADKATSVNDCLDVADAEIKANKNARHTQGTDYSNIVICANYDHPDDAITAIGASNKTLLVTEAETCDTNFEVPANVKVKFERGGKWTINTGITVTFNGSLQAGLWQIFALTGSGTVSGTFVYSPVRPEWWGINGTADDVEINLALTACGAYGTVLLVPTKTYLTSNAIVFTASHQTLTTDGDGEARITSTSADDIVRNLSKTYMKLSNIRLAADAGGSTKTGIRIGDGDTWYSVIRDVNIEGSSVLTQGVCIWNDGAGEVRDYLILFDHVTIRNCRYSWVLGHDMSTGTVDVGVAATEEVNRIKLTNCDDYGFIKYGIYFGNGNGHYISGHHFTNAQANAIADIRWKNYYHHVDAVFESGADYAIDFATNYGYGDVVGDFIGYTRKFRFDGATSTDNYLQVMNNANAPTISYGSALGKVLHARNLQTANIFPPDDTHISLHIYTGKNLYIKQRVAATSSPGDTIFTLDSNGNLTLAGNLTLNNINATAINLGNEDLSTYDEGAVTPVIAFGGASVGMTYGYQTGLYTRVGRLVTVTGRVSLTAKGTSTGNVTITGLPFTCFNNTGAAAAVTLRLNNISFANMFEGQVIINTTTVSLEEITEAGVVTALTDADFADNSEIIFSITYFTA